MTLTARTLRHHLSLRVVLGGGRLLPQLDDLTMLLQQGLSVVLDLSHLGHDEKASYTRSLSTGGDVLCFLLVEREQNTLEPRRTARTRHQ